MFEDEEDRRFFLAGLTEVTEPSRDELDSFTYEQQITESGRSEPNSDSLSLDEASC